MDGYNRAMVTMGDNLITVDINGHRRFRDSSMAIALKKVMEQYEERFLKPKQRANEDIDEYVFSMQIKD